MRALQELLFAAWLIALAASGSRLYAQSPVPPGPASPGLGEAGDAAGRPPASEVTPDVSVPMEKQAQIPPREMERAASEFEGQAEASLRRVERLKAEARRQKDVIKLNCINDKLLQMKQLLNILEDGQSKLSLAIAAGGDDSERYHRYTVVRISAEKITGLRDEAEACVGEEISYLGPLSVDVDQPAVPDDPTSGGNPWDTSPIEAPGYASPFD